MPNAGMEFRTSKFQVSLGNIYSYHKKFTHFQKILIISLIVGTLSILYSRFVTVVALYLLSVITSIIVCRWLLALETYFTFPELILSLYLRLRELESANESHKTGDSLNLTTATGDQDREHEGESSKTKSSAYDSGEETPETNTTGSVSIPEVGHACKHKTSLKPSHWKIEAAIVTEYVVRDFIQPWYRTLPDAKPDILDISHNILQKCLLNFCYRLGQTDKQTLFCDLLTLYAKHLETFQHARMLYKTQPKRRQSEKSTSGINRLRRNSLRLHSIEDAFEKNFIYHHALENETNEAAYIRCLVHTLLLNLLSDHLNDCQAATQLLVEILSQNVIVPLFHMLVDPDFLHECVIVIFSNSEEAEQKNSNFETESQEKVLFGLEIEGMEDKESDESVSGEEENLSESESEFKDAIGDEPNEVEVEPTCIHSEFPSPTQTLCESSESSREQIQEKKLLEPILPKSKSSQFVESENRECDVFRKRSLSDVQSINSFGGTGKQVQEVINTDDVGLFGGRMKKYLNEVASTLKANPISSRISKAMSNEDERLEVQVDANEEKDLESSHDTVILHTQDISPKSSSHFFQPEELSEEKLEEEWHLNDDEIIKEIPNLFVEITIPETETAQELRSSTQYTLYIINYDALHFNEDKELVVRSGQVKRRFREFVNLQGRLEDNEMYKKSLKDIKGPKKWLSLPFGNMDKKSIETRRISLEKFLKALIEKPDISNGPELKEFLAYQGDGHIAFVRKATELSVPRIDKMIVRTVSEVFDKIGELSNKAQERLPRLPGMKGTSPQPDEPRPTKDVDKIDIDYCAIMHHRTQFQVQVGEYLYSDTQNFSSNPELGRPEVKSSNETEQVVSDNDSRTSDFTHKSKLDIGIELAEALEEDQTFSCTKQELETKTDMKADTAMMNETELGRDEITTKDKAVVDDEVKEEMDRSKGTTIDSTASHSNACQESAMIHCVLDVAVKALEGRDNWLCTDKVVSLSTKFVGTTVSKFLALQVDQLTTEEMATFYMQKLKDTVWPNGDLSNEGRVEKTPAEKQHTKELAVKCLAEFFPGMISALVGHEDYKFAISEIIESIQHKKLNKNFILHFLDHLLETLFLEIEKNNSKTSLREKN